MLIIIPCGSKKLSYSTLAWKLYQGPYYKSCLRWALSIEKMDNIRILSAKYGLLRLDEVIHPYELRMGRPGSISLDKIREQAQASGLLSEEVIGLGGRDYTRIIKEIWPFAHLPLEGKGGLGKQMRWLKRHLGKGDFIVSD